MLTPSFRSQFITKILTSKTGAPFRVVFLVTLVDGEVRARIISAESLAGKVGEQTPPLLPVSQSKTHSVLRKTLAFAAVVSPFFNNFLFFTSQPTRAPSSSF